MVTGFPHLIRVPHRPPKGAVMVCPECGRELELPDFKCDCDLEDE